MKKTEMIQIEYKQYTVIFDNNKGEHILVGTTSNYNQAWQLMRKYIDKIGFKSYYVRTTHREYGEWIDYGSHTQFFKIVDKPEMVDSVLNGNID